MGQRQVALSSTASLTHDTAYDGSMSEDTAAEPSWDVATAAHRARTASRDLGQRTQAEKDAALRAAAAALEARSAEVLAANDDDIERARTAGIGEALLDWLRLSADRVTAMADGLRQVAALHDPVGAVLLGYTLPNGLQVEQRRVPLGVVGIIYEARPNVTADAAGLCLKSGNAVLLRGSGSAASSNAAIVTILRDALTQSGLPADALMVVPADRRETVEELMRARGLVDVLIPRGGAGLISTVVQNSTVPVIETGTGNCHVYVDSAADLDRALAIVVNSKTHRPSVCNAAETLLIHAEAVEVFLPKVLNALTESGVLIRGDERVRAIEPSALEVTDEDWDTEFLAAEMSVGVVDTFDQALEHIRQHGSGHTEAIVTDSLDASRRFVAEVDAAAVMINASTRFTDGEQLGFGAEIGISTQKLHARGPMGLTELTTSTYVVTGEGHIRT